MTPIAAIRRLPMLLPAAWLLLALPAACADETQLVGGCRDDAQCVSENGPGWLCSDRFNPRICVCSSDAACGPGRFCNAAGLCQDDVGCVDNADCPEGSVCDTTRGQCIDAGRCTADLQCPVGTLCHPLTLRCEPGCHVSGDCPLGEVCRCPDDQPECGIGQCVGGLCDDETFCGLKEFCEEDPVEGDGVCVEAEGPYCQACTYGPGVGFGLCGDPANYCLVDSSVPGGLASFCGVACEHEAECPNGFGCRRVVILTQAICEHDAECPATGGACEQDADCPGGRCHLETGETVGRCAGTCVKHEDGAARTGFCSCVEDADCPMDTCVSDPSAGNVCELTRAPCQMGADGQCRGQLHCVNLDGVGGCVIGRNCAPDEGVSCADVRNRR